MRTLAKGEMQRDRRCRFGDDDGHIVIAHQVSELFLQIMSEQRWTGDRRRVDAGGRYMAVGQAGVDMPEARGLDADLGIEGAVARGDRRTLRQFGEVLDQEGRVALVKLGQRIDGLDGVVEALRHERSRG
jgi:hypothetical protein